MKKRTETHFGSSTQEDTPGNTVSVDRTLIAIFLKMTPEERIQTNDNMIRAILEMRQELKNRMKNDRGSWQTS